MSVSFMIKRSLRISSGDSKSTRITTLWRTKHPRARNWSLMVSLDHIRQNPAFGVSRGTSLIFHSTSCWAESSRWQVVRLYSCLVSAKCVWYFVFCAFQRIFHKVPYLLKFYNSRSTKTMGFNQNYNPLQVRLRRYYSQFIIALNIYLHNFV